MPETQSEEGWRQLVVLRVGRVRMNRDGALAQPVEALLDAPGLNGGAASELLSKALRAQASNAEPNERIGEQAALGPADEAGSGALGAELGE